MIFIVVSACGAALLPGLERLSPPGTWFRRLVRVIADHAYTLYLVHMPLFTFIGRTFYEAGLATWPVPFVHLPILVATTWILSRYVERPMMRARPAQT